MEREIRVKCTYISLSTSDAAGTAWNTIEHFCFNKAKTTVCHKSDLKCDLKKNQSEFRVACCTCCSQVQLF